LRATIATFAAAIGGADAITVLPFTSARGLPDAFARRVARNTQLVLIEETHRQGCRSVCRLRRHRKFDRSTLLYCMGAVSGD
jgi:hypothetical protein